MSKRRRARKKNRPAKLRSERDPAGRQGVRRYLVPAAAVMCVAAVGFVAVRAFWQGKAGRPSRSPRADRAAILLAEALAGPAFSPQATADDLKHEAIRTSDELLEAYPHSADSLPVAARLQTSLGNLDVAVPLWRRCTEIDPGFVEGYRQLGLAAQQAGDFQQAAVWFEKVVSLDPSDPDAPHQLADALMELGRIEEAVTLLEERMRGPAASDRSMVTLGQAYLQLKQYEKAEKMFAWVIRQDPDERAAYYGLARVCARAGRKEESRKYLKKYQELSPVDFQELARQNRAYTDLATVRNILITVLLESGGVYRGHKNTLKAEQMWREAAHLDAGNVPSRRELLSLYEQQGRDEDALAICTQLSRIEPENPDHWLNVGVLEGRLGRLEAARAALQKAIRLDPHNPTYRQAYALAGQEK